MRKHASEPTGLTGKSRRQQEEAALYRVTADTDAESVILQQAMGIIERRMKVARTALTSPVETMLYLQIRLGHRETETFGALWLDNRHQVIAIEELFQGTIDTAAVYPREVVKKALQHNAAAVIFFHNHPSGHAEPSAADLSITTKLKHALGVIEVRVLDHIVVAESCTSMAERNLL
ncbi:JAB domain-containing protein [uncultured Thiocystis sp.]|jgi:DNA repair protein RadC|uniref:JAB domain-containing protein n=1 Tax=uncultured Thiocystis sp. TaxID=1202134 RepID=UPI00341820A4